MHFKSVFLPNRNGIFYPTNPNFVFFSKKYVHIMYIIGSTDKCTENHSLRFYKKVWKPCVSKLREKFSNFIKTFLTFEHVGWHNVGLDDKIALCENFIIGERIFISTGYRVYTEPSKKHRNMTAQETLNSAIYWAV